MGYGEMADENPYAAPKGDLRRDREPFEVGEPGPARVRLEVISVAWELFKQSMGPWIAMILIAGICSFGTNFVVSMGGQLLLGFLQSARIEEAGFIAALIVVQIFQIALTTLVNSFFGGGLFRAACRQIRGGTIEVGDVFSASDVLVPLFVGSLLVSLATFLGFLCLIIPGFLVAGRLMFTVPLIVEGRLPATEAMRRSWRALAGQSWMAAVFHFVVGLLAGIGVLLCCVGVLFTAPLYTLSIAVLYRDFFPPKSAWTGGLGDPGPSDSPFLPDLA